MAVVGAVAPVITAMNNAAERRVTEVKHRHETQATWVKMSVDPALPLQARAQVLRFLVQDGNEAMVQAWATDELARLQVEIDAVEEQAEAVARDVEASEQMLADAKAEYASVTTGHANLDMAAIVMRRAADVELASEAVKRKKEELTRLQAKLGEPEAVRIYEKVRAML